MGFLVVVTARQSVVDGGPGGVGNPIWVPDPLRNAWRPAQFNLALEKSVPAPIYLSRSGAAMVRPRSVAGCCIVTGTGLP